MNFADRAPRPGVTFRANQRDGIWSVTKDHAFYGDYFSREQAIASACYGARAVEALGGEARVMAGGLPVAHHDLAIAPNEKSQ